MVALSISQASAGYKVNVLYWQKSPEGLSEKMVSKGITLIKKDVNSNYSLKIFWQILNVIKLSNPDIIQTYITQVDIFGGLAALISRTPWVIREPSDKTKRKSSFKLRLRKILGKFASAIVANSINGLNYWAEISVLKKVIRNGYKIEPLINRSFKEVNKKLVYVGRLEKSKNVLLLLESLKSIQNEVAFTLDILGSGSELKNLQEWAKTNNLVFPIRFHGFVSPKEVTKHLLNCDCFCSLSAHEGMPNAVIEAMLLGTPIIASNIPAHKEILDNQSTFWANISEPSEVAQSLKSALTASPKTLTAMSHYSYKKAEKFDTDSMYSNYHLLYQEILSK